MRHAATAAYPGPPITNPVDDEDTSPEAEGPQAEHRRTALHLMIGSVAGALVLATIAGAPLMRLPMGWANDLLQTGAGPPNPTLASFTQGIPGLEAAFFIIVILPSLAGCVGGMLMIGVGIQRIYEAKNTRDGTWPLIGLGLAIVAPTTFVLYLFVSPSMRPWHWLMLGLSVAVGLGLWAFVTQRRKNAQRGTRDGAQQTTEYRWPVWLFVIASVSLLWFVFLSPTMRPWRLPSLGGVVIAGLGWWAFVTQRPRNALIRDGLDPADVAAAFDVVEFRWPVWLIILVVAACTTSLLLFLMPVHRLDHRTLYLLGLSKRSFPLVVRTVALALPVGAGLTVLIVRRRAKVAAMAPKEESRPQEDV